MSERPNSKPLATNYSDITLSSDEEGEEEEAPMALEQSENANTQADHNFNPDSIQQVEAPPAKKGIATQSSSGESGAAANHITVSKKKSRSTKATRQPSTHDFIKTIQVKK